MCQSCWTIKTVRQEITHFVRVTPSKYTGEGSSCLTNQGATVHKISGSYGCTAFQVSSTSEQGKVQDLFFFFFSPSQVLEAEIRSVRWPYHSPHSTAALICQSLLVRFPRQGACQMVFMWCNKVGLTGIFWLVSLFQRAADQRHKKKAVLCNVF